MNYRLITRWEVTEEVSEQYFFLCGDADTISDYLIKATENGAKISWVIQKKQENGQAATLESYGDVGDWENLSWNAD